ncbi:MAG: diguanylate cyclase [Candidatus Omnitrophota bacterium]
MKAHLVNPNLTQIELLERLSSVTEQLEDIVSITQGKQTIEPKISINEIFSKMKGKIGDQVPLMLFSLFKLFTMKSLLRGRMRYTAYNIGKQTAFSVRIQSVDKVAKKIQELGIGELKIVKNDGKMIEARLKSSMTSMGISGAQQALCYFEAGFLSGIFEKLLKQRVNFVEVECSAKGDEACRFRAALNADRTGRSLFSQFPLDTEIFSQENIKLLTSLAAHAIAAIENSLIFEQTKRQSVVDGLTQIYNHRYFQQSIRVELNRAVRHKMPIALVMLDIDNFKNFNDKFGHPEGDEVLKAVALLLLNSVRDIDVVARYGGDEFAMVLPQTTLEGAGIVAMRMKDKAKELFSKKEFSKRGIHLGICMGVTAVWNKRTSNPAQLIRKADKALLMAKSKGKSRVEIIP